MLMERVLQNQPISIFVIYIHEEARTTGREKGVREREEGALVRQGLSWSILRNRTEGCIGLVSLAGHSRVLAHPSVRLILVLDGCWWRQAGG